MPKHERCEGVCIVIAWIGGIFLCCSMGWGIAAFIVFLAGFVLALANPGGLGGGFDI